MSRGRIALILACSTFVIWFYVNGQELQSVQVALILGFILGTLFGWWTGGGRVLRKIRKVDHERVDSDYKKNRETLL